MDLRWLIPLSVVTGLAVAVWVSLGVGILTLIGGLVLVEFILVRDSQVGDLSTIVTSQKTPGPDENLSELLEAFRRDTHI